MAHRQFIAADGTEWVAYDVTPRADDRRSNNRRQGEAVAVEETEDRRTDDRRVAVGGMRPVQLTQGWLCFEREDERRRLQPIPLGWNALPDAEVALLLDKARPAPHRKRTDGSAADRR